MFLSFFPFSSLKKLSSVVKQTNWFRYYFICPSFLRIMQNSRGVLSFQNFPPHKTHGFKVSFQYLNLVFRRVHWNPLQLKVYGVTLPKYVPVFRTSEYFNFTKYSWCYPLLFFLRLLKQHFATSSELKNFVLHLKSFEKNKAAWEYRRDHTNQTPVCRFTKFSKSFIWIYYTSSSQFEKSVKWISVIFTWGISILDDIFINV